MLTGSLFVSIDIPIESENAKQQYAHCYMKYNVEGSRKISLRSFYAKQSIDLNKIKNNGVKIGSKNLV